LFDICAIDNIDFESNRSHNGKKARGINVTEAMLITPKPSMKISKDAASQCGKGRSRTRNAPLADPAPATPLLASPVSVHLGGDVPISLATWSTCRKKPSALTGGRDSSRGSLFLAKTLFIGCTTPGSGALGDNWDPRKDDVCGFAAKGVIVKTTKELSLEKENVLDEMLEDLFEHARFKGVKSLTW
jgi:hypothetical protein